jgi:hypothetical protein
VPAVFFITHPDVAIDPTVGGVTGYNLVGPTASWRKAWAWIGVGVATRVKL